MRVQYVGKKPFHADNHFGTGAVWEGEGDVKSVPDETGAAMIAHFPDVYAPVSDAPHVPEAQRDAAGLGTASILETATLADTDGETVTLAKASYNGLRRYVAELGIRTESGVKRTELLEILADYLKVAGTGEQGKTPPKD